MLTERTPTFKSGASLPTRKHGAPRISVSELCMNNKIVNDPLLADSDKMKGLHSPQGGPGNQNAKHQ